MYKLYFSVGTGWDLQLGTENHECVEDLLRRTFPKGGWASVERGGGEVFTKTTVIFFKDHVRLDVDCTCGNKDRMTYSDEDWYQGPGSRRSVIWQCSECKRIVDVYAFLGRDTCSPHARHELEELAKKQLEKTPATMWEHKPEAGLIPEGHPLETFVGLACGDNLRGVKSGKEYTIEQINLTDNCLPGLTLVDSEGGRLSAFDPRFYSLVCKRSQKPYTEPDGTTHKDIVEKEIEDLWADGKGLIYSDTPHNFQPATKATGAVKVDIKTEVEVTRHDDETDLVCWFKTQSEVDWLQEKTAQGGRFFFVTCEQCDKAEFELDHFAHETSCKHCRQLLTDNFVAAMAFEYGIDHERFEFREDGDQCHVIAVVTESEFNRYAKKRDESEEFGGVPYEPTSDSFYPPCVEIGGCDCGNPKCDIPSGRHCWKNL